MQQILNQLPYARFLGLEGQEGGADTFRTICRGIMKSLAS